MPGHKFLCPKCGYPQHCGCDSCKVHRPPPDGIKGFEWVDGEAVKCAGCGYTNSADWWADQEYQQYERQRKELLNEGNNRGV